MSAPPSHGANHHLPKLIVIVDDEEEIGTLITELIHEHTAHEVQQYTTGKQTLQAMRNSHAHLLILDYTLPDMSGLELHDRLRTLEHLCNGSCPVDQRHETAAAGATAARHHLSGKAV